MKSQHVASLQTPSVLRSVSIGYCISLCSFIVAVFVFAFAASSVSRTRGLIFLCRRVNRAAANHTRYSTPASRRSRSQGKQDRNR
uniref:Secreted protein n=1 Tax=Steinernema glaseri TaxID=37863 RepID=A0A1I7YZX8_9BILA